MSNQVCFIGINLISWLHFLTWHYIWLCYKNQAKLFQNIVKIRKGLNILVQIKATLSSHFSNILGTINAMRKTNYTLSVTKKQSYLSELSFTTSNMDINKS